MCAANRMCIWSGSRHPEYYYLHCKLAVWKQPCMWNEYREGAALCFAFMFELCFLSGILQSLDEAAMMLWQFWSWASFERYSLTCHASNKKTVCFVWFLRTSSTKRVKSQLSSHVDTTPLTIVSSDNNSIWGLGFRWELTVTELLISRILRN